MSRKLTGNKKVKQRRRIQHTNEGPVETVYTEIEVYDALDVIWKIT